MKYLLVPLMIFLMSIVPSSCQFEDYLDAFKSQLPSTENSFSGENSYYDQQDGSISIGGDYQEGDVVIGTLPEGGIGIIDKETETPDEPVSSVFVQDAINYTKPIKGYTFSQSGQLVVDTENAGAYGNHKIRVPKLVGDEDKVKELNEKFYAPVESMHNALLNDAEGVNTYNVDYYHSENPKAIAIIQEISEGEQMLGGYTYYRTYYYDCQKQVEITFDEYIALFGFTKETFQAKIKTLETKYFSFSDTDVKNVAGVVLGEDFTYVVVNFPDAMDPDPSSGMFSFQMGIIE